MEGEIIQITFKVGTQPLDQANEYIEFVEEQEFSL